MRNLKQTDIEKKLLEKMNLLKISYQKKGGVVKDS